MLATNTQVAKAKDLETDKPDVRCQYCNSPIYQASSGVWLSQRFITQKCSCSPTKKHEK